jgi:hypothetical protein
VRRRPPRLPGRAAAPPAAHEEAPALPEPEDAGQPDPAGKYAERTRRHHDLVHQLRAEGRGLREIARHLGWGLHTVQSQPAARKTQCGRKGGRGTMTS